MQLDKTRFSVRIVRQRNFDELLNRVKELRVAVCIGNTPNILLAAATSVALGQNELEIANTLEPFGVTKAQTFDAWIPAEAEFVLEGVVRLEEKAKEGPFVDLTGTYDFVREEPAADGCLKGHRACKRVDGRWMGMPHEIDAFQAETKRVQDCLHRGTNTIVPC